MKFYVIGIDDNQNQEFSSTVQNIISHNLVFSGGKRHHEIVRSLLPNGYKWIDIIVPLDSVLECYKKETTVVVFTSGDPLFFGFGNTLLREFPNADIEIFPTLNSLQLLAHRLQLPYHDMHIVSLTGRPWAKFDQALIQGTEKIGVLTDRKVHTPSTIAQRMQDYGYDNYTMSIGELLGNQEEEQVSTWEIKDVIGKEFKYPNNLILEIKEKRVRPFGLPNEEFFLLNNRVNMITKMPIRLLSLSMLDLRDRKTFWDIGFCTGSISIEAKLQFPHLNIVAFEQREEGKELMEKNSKKWGAPGIEYYIGDFTAQKLDELTPPDAVFIGGHGGKMNEIIGLVNRVLPVGGIIVFNSVSEDSQKLFRDAIQVHQLRLIENLNIKIDDYNSILVMKAVKEL